MTTRFRRGLSVLALLLAIPLVLTNPAQAALAAPTRIAISVTTSTAAFSWPAVANAKSYFVCLQASKTSTSCATSGRTTATKATFTGLAPTGGTDYFVSVTAENGSATRRSALIGFDLATAQERPGTPAAVSQSIGETSAKIWWSQAPGATSYAICLLTSPTASTCTQFRPSSTSTTATFDDLVPSEGPDYYYRIVSYNSAGYTASPTYSFELATAPDPPGTPAAVSQSIGETSAKIWWSQAPGATSYAICLLTSPTASTCTQFRPSSTSTTATFDDLVPSEGPDYYYRIVSYNSAGYTASPTYSFELATAPDPPGTPAAVSQSIGETSAKIWWSQAPGATSYAICLLTSPTASTCTQFRPSSTSTTATFDDLVPSEGPDYYYRIVSYNSAGYTASPTYSFELKIPAVAAITDLTAKEDSEQRIVLNWSAPRNAKTYEVQLSTGKSMTTGVLKVVTSSPTYTSATLKPGMTYYFRVRALNGADKGAFTDVGALRIGTDGTVVRVVSYNLCGQDRCLTSANKMSKWSTVRKPLAGALVRSTDADIVATQESTTRDTDFGSQLPEYTLAHYKSAKSLFYKTSKYTEVDSGSITLSSSLGKYAVWADLKDVTTATRFIIVDVHLESGKGKTKDDERTSETTILLDEIEKINPTGLPVIYAGDYNSNASNAKQSNYPGGYDAPRQVFAAAGVIDSYDVAESMINETYNSANQAINPPLRHSHHVDHIYTSDNIKTIAWYVLIRMSGSNYKVPFATDHNAIAADLLVPGR